MYLGQYMKLDEIVKIAQQPTGGFSLSDFMLERAEQITTAENLPVFHIPGGPKDPTLHCYAVRVDNQYVSMLIGRVGSFNGRTAVFIARTYTLPSYRNKGLVTSLYRALYSRMKYVLISDGEMSPETISVWEKLAASLPVKVVNMDSTTSQPLKDVPLDQMVDGNEHIRLMLETGTIDPSWIGVPESYSPILADYINFTHPDNDGLYL